MRYTVLDSFKAQTVKGEMQLQAGQIITLPEEKAAILIKTGKIQLELTETERIARAQIAAPFDEIFRSASDEIYERYLDGTIEHTEKHYSSLYQKIDEADDRMMTAWQSGIEGKADLDYFRKAVDDWKLLHFQAIEAYRHDTNPYEGKRPGRKESLTAGLPF